MSKLYKYGLYLGRFQPLHIGHASIISKMIKECETVIIAVGSAQESGTERNPLPFGFRKALIQHTFGSSDRLLVLPINDRKAYSDDPTWGDYLLGNVYNQCGLEPDVIYEGKEHVRTNWYDNYNIPVVKVSREDVPITGTELRSLILNNMEISVKVYLPRELHDLYDSIRKEIQNAGLNKERNQLD